MTEKTNNTRFHVYNLHDDATGHKLVGGTMGGRPDTPPFCSSPSVPDMLRMHGFSPRNPWQPAVQLKEST